MPVYRTPDGKIVEEKTRINRGGDAGERPAAGDKPPAAGSRYDAETVVNTPGAGASAPQGAPTPPATPAPSTAPAADSGATRLAGIGGSTPAAVQQVDDPVVGWLVVVEGPGRGGYAALGVGRNSIGRDAGERVSLNYGDDGISRQGHLVIVYDHRGRRFFIQPGQGQNLTYMNGEPVLDSQQLEPGALLTLSDTVVRFVPFCGEEFDWTQPAAE